MPAGNWNLYSNSFTDGAKYARSGYEGCNWAPVLVSDTNVNGLASKHDWVGTSPADTGHAQNSK